MRFINNLTLFELDVLSALSYLGPNCSVEDVLIFLRRKKVLSSNGYRGGFSFLQKLALKEAIKKVKNSKPLKPNLKILYYHPLKECWQKYLGYVLAMQNKKEFQIQINRILPNSNFYPKKLREKFEYTLNILKNDGIIQAWSYAKIDEELLSTSKNWIFYWKILSVKIKLL